MSKASRVSVAADGAGRAIWVVETQVTFPDGPTLGAAIAAGATVTAITCTALPWKILAGQQITLEQTSGRDDTYTLSADAAQGATSIAVNSQVAAYAHAVGTAIALPVEAQVVIFGRSDGSLQEPEIAVNLVRAIAGEDLNNDLLRSVPPDEWSLTSAGASNVQATVTKAAVSGKKHVLRSIVAACVPDSPPAPAPSATLIIVRDGPSGTGTLIWSAYMEVSGQSGQAGGSTIQLSNLKIPVTNGNALTAEFLSAAGVKTIESVSITGITEF